MCLLYREMQMDSIALHLFTETYPARCVFPINVLFATVTKKQIKKILKYILHLVFTCGKTWPALTIKHTDTMHNNKTLNKITCV